MKLSCALEKMNKLKKAVNGPGCAPVSARVKVSFRTNLFTLYTLYSPRTSRRYL